MSPRSFKKAYDRFLNAIPGRLHFAAHSHHYWPDCTRDAGLQYWDDSARFADEKWEFLFKEILSPAKRSLCSLLGLTDPDRFAFAPNTHEFVARLYSCFEPAKPLRVLTTDSEFHSFSRQTRRLEELENVEVERVPVEPFESFEERFAERARKPRELIFFSHVFYNSGYRIADLKTIASSAHPDSVLVVDGYHACGAVPVDLSEIRERIFYLGGGYKYLQAGEGACFLYVPPGTTLRPANTGWFAEFENLQSTSSQVPYSETGARFAGSTFDPTGWYRFNAVMRWWKEDGIDVHTVHEHVQGLQKRFLEAIDGQPFQQVNARQLLKAPSSDQQGHFFSFKTSGAEKLTQALRKEKVIVDFRGDRLRFGFGLHQDPEDVDLLIERIATAERQI